MQPAIGYLRVSTREQGRSGMDWRQIGGSRFCRDALRCFERSFRQSSAEFLRVESL
jgi:DNA invertase Pin-like site-specific DNA recombinase